MGDAQCGKIREAIGLLAFEGEPVSWNRYGSGHINDTFRLICKTGDGEKHYIIQRINHEVFKDPVSLMRNIAGVTSFLRERIETQGGDPARETLNIVKATDGKDYCQDSDGNYWRGYLFIGGATTYDKVRQPEDFYRSGKAFGRFKRLLAEYPADELAETIPDFHNTPVRMEAFKAAVKADTCGRAHLVEAEIKFALDREKEAAIAMNMLKEGRLPLCVTHNDTKLNNIMIDDETGEALCVIDLDTIMPGLSIFDFGDSIRFGANTAEEDEPDVSKVSLSLPLFETYTRGYLEGCKGSLSPDEKKMLPMGAKLMTFECGVRFLTDFLQGDTYFHTSRENHNLDRTRTQFALVADMEKKWEEMEEIVRKSEK
ncbi:phosphotransferase enzyme family protein [Lacrimispora sp.]|uniref:phosphotransferase enzyme family protein n=2 Tax=Lacrimispora sp. TaxID=2719234 RepID=UPI00289FEC6D|nr:aminoglycoside phosphotransferase family protein [Lacrimispora sp.]